MPVIGPKPIADFDHPDQAFVRERTLINADVNLCETVPSENPEGVAARCVPRN